MVHVIIPCYSATLYCHCFALTSLHYYFSIHAYLINFGTEQGRRNYMSLWIYRMTSVDTHLSFPMYISFNVPSAQHCVLRRSLVYFNLTEEGDVSPKEIDFEKNMTIIEISPETKPNCSHCLQFCT